MSADGKSKMISQRLKMEIPGIIRHFHIHRTVSLIFSTEIYSARGKLIPLPRVLISRTYGSDFSLTPMFLLHISRGKSGRT